ncbi:MAG TPA: FHA domain-containing protein, partial [Myxococcaceae bacterium]|nr:FHA domain-containing protein [Myxococcaceae bacterium]
MPTLVVRHPDGNESEHPLSGELRIGRQEGNELVLSEGGVSRRHARVWAEGGKVMVEDLGSANGTFVDGERIAGPTPLTSRSQVLLGDYELRLKAPARQGSGNRRALKASPEESPGEAPVRATRAMPSLKARQAAAAGQPSPLSKRPRPSRAGGEAAEAGEGSAEQASGSLVLKGLTGPWANQRYPVQGKLVVGRQSPPATVLLEDDSVSRRHAEVDETPEGAVLRDMGSANGTLVNSQPVGTEEVVLQPGDIIQFGMVEMVLEDGAGSALV